MLIGPNGSGKSNLIAAAEHPASGTIRFSRRYVLVEGLPSGSDKGTSQASCFTIEATVPPLPPNLRETLRYRCQVSNMAAGMYPYLDQEEVAYEAGPDGTVASGETLYSLNRGVARIRPSPLPTATTTTPSPAAAPHDRSLKEVDLNPTESVLAQFRGPDTYPEITGLAYALARITL